MDEGLRYISVVDVSVAVPAGNGVEAGMLVLEEQGEPYRRIRMIIGQPEARAIRVAWRNEIPPRPSTWDLFVSTISLLGGSIEAAVLTDVEEGRHYFAELHIRSSGAADALPVTARPSDAIALALRAPAARLLARDHVLDGVSASEAPARLADTAPIDSLGEAPGAEGEAAAPAREAGPAKKAAVRKAAAKKVAPAKKAAAKKAAPAKKTAVKKAAAKKGTAERAVPVKKASSAAARKAPVARTPQPPD